MFKPVDAKQNFIEMEKKWLKHWSKNGIVQKYLDKNKASTDVFSFQDGPITANNPMGVHHAWGRTYKDLWQKFFNLLGYKEQFQNGFDCQGLWIEVEVEKQLGLKNKKEIENLVPGNKKDSIDKFVQLCKDRVYRFAEIQTEQSKRLGYFMDWDHSYFTMSDENNYMIWHFLKKCHENGWIYKGHESVPWCPRCETAISQHEMLTEDYKEITHDSIYFKLPIEGKKDEYLLVWTTTPWTIPANIAVAVDSKIDYVLVKVKNETFWLAKDAVERVLGKGVKIIKKVKGKQLTALKYLGPFDDLPAVAKVKKQNPQTFHTVVVTDDKILPISNEEGTGLVHTAVSAGTEDFRLGKKYGLPMVPVIADNADYLPDMGEFAGKNAKKHPELIINFLKKKDNGRFLLKVEPYRHRYPACWRCKTELVWKVADEWYIAMDKKDKKGKTLRQRMVAVAAKITWKPSFGLERELDWLKNMNDWLISKKNRYWGLALPIYECLKCGNFEVLGSKEELKKRSVRGWGQFEGKSPHKPFIDDVLISCSKCGTETRRIADVGNPWLDAGIVPYSTITEKNQGEPLYLKNRKEWQKWFPRDFITESFPGQFKNWFYALIAMSTVLEDTNPFKTVLGFGTLLGEDGRPMHKSWGNAIEFNEGADKIGVDVMRWMYTRQDPADNMLFGYRHADEIRRQFYLILWNTYKFFVEYANLEKFNPKDSSVSSKNVLDLWILSRLNNMNKTVKNNLLKFNPKEAMNEIELFVKDLSTWYVRRSRERIWVNSEDRDDKKDFYSTLYSVLVDFSVILSPFVPFISEEIYTNLTEKESVHLATWPAISEKMIDEKLEAEIVAARGVVEIAHSKRKELKIKIRQPLNSLTSIAPIQFGPGTISMIANELNVKEVQHKVGDKLAANIVDAVLSDSLKKEGEARELIRKIQSERKKLGTRLDEKVLVELPEWPSEFEAEIKRKALVDKLIKEKNFKVVRK